ncbi:MAG: hypothetical protein SGBAC_013371, partial [Bacillariaceae sp.]
QKDTVRVAMNASFLQRLVGTGYYFYDDISVPINTALSSSASLQKDDEKPLLAEPSADSARNPSDNEFSRLWISLCTRLAKNEQQYQQSNQKYLAIFLLLWLVAITLLIVLVGDVFELPPTLFLLIPALLAVSTKWVFICLPEKQGVYFTKMLMMKHNENENAAVFAVDQETYFQEIQTIVDDMSPSFTEIGCTLDYVEDFRTNYPFLAYIRMTVPSSDNNHHNSAVLASKHGMGSSSYSSRTDDDDDDGYVIVKGAVSTSSASSSPQAVLSLSDRLCRFQLESWEEHSGQVADHIQEQQRLRSEQKQSDQMLLLGIPIQKLAPYRNMIIYVSMPIGFFWLVLNSGTGAAHFD